MIFRPVSTSWSTRCRWLNVPLWASCPVKRIGMPSMSRLPSARDSACPQSILRFGEKTLDRWPSCLQSLGCGEKLSGTLTSASLIVSSTVSATPDVSGTLGISRSSSGTDASRSWHVLSRRRPARRVGRERIASRDSSTASS